MKKFILATLLLLAAFVVSASAQTCAKIKDGGLTDTKGNPITLGFDKYGYNYQAHMFNGLYANFGRPDPVVETGNVNLIMKWSDDWLANVSCDGNAFLDRGGLDTDPTTNTSKGWLTNHMEGDCTGADGQPEHFTYFAKIVYDGGAACNSTPASPQCLWGSYVIIEEIVNNAPPGGDPGPCSGNFGRSYLKNPAGLGFGFLP